MKSASNQQSNQIKYFNIVKDESKKVFLIVLMDRRVIFRTNDFMRFAGSNIRWINVRGIKYGVISTSQRRVVIDFLSRLNLGEFGFISGIANMISTLVRRIKTFCVGVSDPHSFPLVMDILSLLTTLTCNTLVSWTPAFLLSSLVRFWSIYVRVDLIFKGESEALLAAAATMLLPPNLLDYVKRINVLTSRKLFDTPSLFLDLVSCVSGFILDCVKSIKCVPSFIVDLLERFLSIGTRYKHISHITSLVNSWSSNRRLMLSEEWRLKVKELYETLEKDDMLKEYLKTSTYAAAKYKEFLRLFKSVLSYEQCSRVEPACIVFDGPPGVQKSIVVTQLLKYMGLTSYVHATKSVDDGKDFYDSYNSEQVFVMDDVGQQGASQWRSIINMVSSVKLPLDCASADLKDTKYFSSDLILLTTNNFINLTGLTKSDCISDVTALWRRGHVISFHGVKADKGDLIGKINYQRWCIKANKWVNTMIDGKPFTPSVEASDRNKVIAWLSYLTKRLMNHYSQVKTDSEITNSQRVIIEDCEKTFEEEFEPNILGEDDSIYDSSCEQESVSLTGTILVDFALFVLKSFIGFIFTNVIDTLIAGSSSVLVNASMLVSIAILLYNMFVKFFSSQNISVEQIEDTAIDFSPKQAIIDRWRTATSSQSTSLVVNGQSLTIESIKEGLPSNVEAVRKRMGIVELPFQQGDEWGQDYCQALTSGHYLIVVGHSLEGQNNSAKILNFYTDPESMLNDSPLLNNIPYTVAYNNPALDICILQLPFNSIPPFKLCNHFFNNKVDNSVLKPFFVNCFGEVNISSTIKVPNQTIYYQTNSKKKGLAAGTYFQYPITSAGLCGSLIVDGKAGIIGMHVAGDGEQGNAIILSANEKQRIYNILSNEKHLIPEDSKFKIGDFDQLNKKDNFSGAEYASPVQQHVPHKTSLISSPLLGFVPPSKFPANLSAFGPSTVKKMADKAYKPIPPLPQDEVDFAAKCIRSFLCEYDVLTEEEIICGGEFLSGINKDSVNGFGFEKDKAFYIDFENKKFKPDFAQKLIDFENDIKQGRVKIEDVLHYETLKDELRLEHKVNKPRSFRVCPLTVSILTKKYLGNLFRHIVKHKWFNQIMIGANPYADWERLYEDLVKDSTCLWDGDVGEFDGRQSAQIQDMVAKEVENMYIGKDKEILNFLLELTVRVIVITLNKLRVTTHSISSGSWITGLFNSFNNRSYTACCYFRESKKKGVKPMVSEFLTIRDFVCGDDKLCAVGFSLEDRVNAITMKNFFNSIGMTFTQGDKSEIITKGMEVENLSFLKRKFEYHHKLKKIVGPLSVETLENSIQWLDGRKDSTIVLEGKLAAFQREMYLHQHTYKNQIEKLQSFCQLNKVNFKLLPEFYLYSLFKNDPEEAFVLYKRDFNKNYDNF